MKERQLPQMPRVKQWSVDPAAKNLVLSIF